MGKPSPQDRNLTWHYHEVTRDDRQKVLGHRGATIWFTGLSGSGKSTVADAVASRLHDMGVLTAILDGDNIRHGLNSDLGFSPEDRTENIRRISEVARLFTSFGVVNLLAFISPYRAGRDGARRIQKEGDFFEVYVKVPLEVAEDRDPKGLYKKARAGEIKSFTGIDAPYEEPESPELVLDTSKLSPEESAERVIAMLREKGVIPAE